MVERANETRKNKNSSKEGLESVADDQKDVIRNKLEKAEAEHRQRNSREEVLAAAQELAGKAEEETTKEHSEPKESLRRAPSKKQRADSFKSQMNELQREMTPGARIMSKVIHNAVVERVSDIAGSTVARPNAMLSGSIAAFIGITVLYFIARYYGYHLSGFETVFAFAIGWIVGILYDYFRTLFDGRNS